ncbi:MAG: hypothetical protein JWO67_1278 [Streptosporangiaceae bacterium]|nr:hypothetical protein [Streptosporangiaceae bacterium]
MAKQTGLGARLYLGGDDLSGDIQSVAISGGPALLDVTDITQSAYSRLGGLRDGNIKIVSYWDPSLAHPVLSQLPTTDQIVTYATAPTIGAPSASLNGLQINYDGTRGTDGSYTFAVEAQADGFGLEWGVMLTPGMRTDSTATAASSANSFDTGASLSLGGQAYLHVNAFSGTSVTVAIWDSADNSTFAAVTSFAFTAATAASTQQRIAIGSSATIRRYVAVATTGTFSSAQFAVQMTKNPVAVTF